MDWLSEWDPAGSMGIDQVDPAFDTGRLTAWLILAVVGLAIAVAWYRLRVFHRSFWCLTSRRDVEVRFRLGCVLSCSAFEDPSAMTCARPCLDRSFRMQWPPALPVLMRPHSSRVAHEGRP